MRRGRLWMSGDANMSVCSTTYGNDITHHSWVAECVRSSRYRQAKVRRMWVKPKLYRKPGGPFNTFSSSGPRGEARSASTTAVEGEECGASREQRTECARPIGRILRLSRAYPAPDHAPP